MLLRTQPGLHRNEFVVLRDLLLLQKLLLSPQFVHAELILGGLAEILGGGWSGRGGSQEHEERAHPVHMGCAGQNPSAAVP